MKRLCFGSFITVLVRCKLRQHAQKRLCGTILLSVAPTYDIREDDGTTSRLVLGNDNLSPIVTRTLPKENLYRISEYFSKEVIPMLDPNKQNIIIMALKEIIAEDDDIQPNTVVEVVNGFTKKDIEERSSFVFAEFLAGIFLYTVANVTNKGYEDAVSAISVDYINSLTIKATYVSTIASYSNLKVEFATELAVGASDIAMLVETGGNCQQCGRPLGIKKEDKYVNYAKRIHLSENVYIVVCVECEPKIHTLSDIEKENFITEKHSLENLNIARDAISRHDIEVQIQDVLKLINDMDESDETKLKIEPIKVESKITEKRLKDRVLWDVTRLYDGVNNALDNLSGENRINVNKFAKSVKRMFEDASETLTSQNDIYFSLVDSLYQKCGRKHRVACEIIISYFVQSCEVFNEITK